MKYDPLSLGHRRSLSSFIALLATLLLAAPGVASLEEYDVGAGQTNTLSGILSGFGWGFTKTGDGVLILTGDNTFTGPMVVEQGTLQLASTTGGAAAGVTNSIVVGQGAVLLLMESNQVGDTAPITLSGGTIRRGGDVSEVFGALTLTSASFLDFGTSNQAGHLSFASYTPSALLTVQGFMHGNTLSFGSDLRGSINDPALFKFEGGFRSLATSWDGNTFTITALPEPSTYLAVAGLIGLMLWPSRRRIIRDVKKILGLTPPMRDRLAARNKA
jgi:autotransporter-associated beta strand protein